MNKLLSFLCLAAFLLIPRYPVYAQDTATSSAKPTFQEKFQLKADAIKDRFEAHREKMASRTAQLRTKLQTFKDKRKATLAEKINATLNNINSKRADHWIKFLGVFEDILTKVENRTSEVSQAGTDTTSVQTAIDQAKDKIAKAKSAVDEQRLKDYTIEATSESTIRADAKAARDRLHTDLKATQAVVAEARRAVVNAIRSLAQVLGEAQGGSSPNATQQ